MLIKKGYAMLYYCFDVGEEIELSKLEKILGKKTEKFLLSFKRLTPAYIQYKVPPLFVRLGKYDVKTNDMIIDMTCDAKIYDFGIVVIRFTVPITGSFANMKKLSYELSGNVVIEKLAISQLKDIVNEIFTAIIKPREKLGEDWEDYIIFLVQELDKEVNTEILLKKCGREIANILRPEKGLGKEELDDSLKYCLSYYKNDLTVIDWNSAFVYDPTKSYDVPDVIEYAVIELLELRVYDSLLDEILDRAYDDLTKEGFKIFPFSRTLQKLSQIKLDISEVIEKVENSLKLIGDLYLAKVYAAASTRLYLDKWKSNVRYKLAALETLYSVEWDRAQTRRTVILEAMIVLLFIVDLILLISGRI
jgi:hypothetical protein